MTDDGSRKDLYRAQSSPPRTALSPAPLTADPRISPSPDALRSGTPQPSQISRRTTNAIRPQHNSMSSPHPDTPQPRSWSSLSSRIGDYLTHSTRARSTKSSQQFESPKLGRPRMDESFAAGECRWELSNTLGAPQLKKKVRPQHVRPNLDRSKASERTDERSGRESSREYRDPSKPSAVDRFPCRCRWSAACPVPSRRGTPRPAPSLRRRLPTRGAPGRQSAHAG